MRDEKTLSKTEEFTLKERIKKYSEIQHIFRKGEKISTTGAKLYILPNGLSFNRIAFTLPRGFGNAVQRNHSKRLSREVYRHLKSITKSGYDMVLLIYNQDDLYNTRVEQLNSLYKKAGLL